MGPNRRLLRCGGSVFGMLADWRFFRRCDRRLDRSLSLSLTLCLFVKCVLLCFVR